MQHSDGAHGYYSTRPGSLSAIEAVPAARAPLNPETRSSTPFSILPVGPLCHYAGLIASRLDQNRVRYEKTPVVDAFLTPFNSPHQLASNKR